MQKMCYAVKIPKNWLWQKDTNEPLEIVIIVAQTFIAGHALPGTATKTT